MAIAVQVDIKGMTLEQYDEGGKEAGFVPGGPGPTGMVSHCLFRTADGWRAFDVWESREQWDEFLEGLKQAAKDAGLEPPKVQYFEVHNYMTANPTR